MKQYNLKLSDKSTEIADPSGGKPINILETEISLLKFMIKEYANDSKDLEDFNYATSLIGDINGAEKTGSLILTEKDLNNIKKGFVKTASKRTWIWTEMADLFNQLEKPEEIVPKEEKPEESVKPVEVKKQ